MKHNRAINHILCIVRKFIYNEEIDELISLFNDGENFAISGTDIKEDVLKLRLFAERWDYRLGKERWDVIDESFVLEHEGEIMECVRGLGLVGHVDPSLEPDYILPLGGARNANNARPKMAKKVIDDYGWTDKRIVALSGTRPINDTERPYMKEYAPDVETEFDAISKGLELAFDVHRFTEERIDSDNINLCSVVRKYENDSLDNEIYSLAAPSSDPDNRRANSYDTFKYLLEKFDIGEGDKLLLVTSCIYVPYQRFRFMDLAIENGFEVDCIGADPVDDFSLSKPSNYLQEVKATIDVIYDLVCKYCS